MPESQWSLDVRHMQKLLLATFGKPLGELFHEYEPFFRAWCPHHYYDPNGAVAVLCMEKNGLEYHEIVWRECRSIVSFLVAHCLPKKNVSGCVPPIWKGEEWQAAFEECMIRGAKAIKSKKGRLSLHKESQQSCCCDSPEANTRVVQHERNINPDHLLGIAI